VFENRVLRRMLLLERGEGRRRGERLDKDCIMSFINSTLRHTILR
jgi:hypothetical protein